MAGMKKKIMTESSMCAKTMLLHVKQNPAKSLAGKNEVKFPVKTKIPNAVSARSTVMNQKFTQ
jgi:hypothetical protein